MNTPARPEPRITMAIELSPAGSKPSCPPHHTRNGVSEHESLPGRY
ncbi:hypothetical protein [Amycolatopsis sp. WAC 01375]|nr:hypothetical protein [Amycolatopsis sp. WAC 01375]